MVLTHALVVAQALGWIRQDGIGVVDQRLSVMGDGGLRVLVGVVVCQATIGRLDHFRADEHWAWSAW